MGESRKDKTRKDKQQAFQTKAKQEAAQAKIPKTHLVPQTEWQSAAILDLRGDLLEILEKQMVATYENLQQAHAEFSKAAQVLQMIMSNNVKSGKIKLSYAWNNGEKATDEDVADFKLKMEQIQKKRLEQIESLKKSDNAAKTGLVGPEGEPIGTTQNLDQDQTNIKPDENPDQQS